MGSGFGEQDNTPPTVKSQEYLPPHPRICQLTIIVIIIIIIIIDSIQFANKKSCRSTALHLPNRYWCEIGLGSVFEE